MSYEKEISAAMDGRLGADRMALGLSIIPDKCRGDMDIVKKLLFTMRLHAGDCCSLNNEVELFRGHWEDAEDRVVELEVENKRLKGLLKEKKRNSIMGIESFKDIEKRCIGVVGTGGYYPFGSSVLIKTNKVKGVPIGTYIGPNYKPTMFTPQEKLVVLIYPLGVKL